MTTPQPELLARWLQHQLDRGDVGTPPPAGLDPDVVEAVDALRPDLAPVPELDLDELLAGVTQGPFAVPAGESEHLAASELARRLDGGPLTPEQAADLDEGAFAAMAAIRPATELTLRIWPLFLLRIPGNTAWMQRIAPQ